MTSELEQQIKDSFPNGTTQAATGYWTVKCPVCRDEIKRGGFKFEEDQIIYNCFRGKCSAKGAYKYGEPMHRTFKNIMKAFKVDVPIEYLTYKSKIAESLNVNLFEKHHYENIKLPDNFVRIDKNKHNSFWLYLKNRNITGEDFYIGQKGQWYNKLIIPFRLHDSIIGWQGIDIKTGHYLKSSCNTDMIYLADDKVPKDPLIVEGVFDAKSVPNGIATLQSNISRKQAYFLRYSNPILIPDRKGSNYLKAAKNYGWRVSIPEWKEKDTNAAVQKYGKLIVAKMIHDGTCNSYIEAEVKYKMWRTK